MGKVDLQSDEVVVIENKYFSVRSIPLDATITNRHLILTDTRKNAIPQRNIPLAAIRSIEAGENAEKDQTVTLELLTEDGTLRQMILTLSRQAGIERKWEYDEWVKKLKEHTVSATAMAQMSRRDTPGIGAQGQAFVKTDGELPKLRDAVPEYIPYVPKSSESSLPAKAPKRSPVITIVAIILVILIIVSAVVIFGQLSKGKGVSPAGKGVAMVITPQATTTLTPIPSPTILAETPTILTPVTTAIPQYIIPKTGTWVRVQYPNNFIGYVGVRGFNKQLNSTQEQWVQISATEGMIEGSIEKQDGSTDNLIVEIYKDGAPVYSKNTRTPYGVLDLHYTL
ncbi:MAG: hypothetical protein NTZ39_05240 [Methanoregula sp.]|nr:hypothetical protein [Methanoregula sp.]